MDITEKTKELKVSQDMSNLILTINHKSHPNLLIASIVSSRLPNAENLR